MANFQLVNQFSEDEQNENKRFVEASDAELEELSKKSFKKNTQYATRNAVNIYKKNCEQLGIQSDLKKMTELTLAEILKKLYAGTRKQDCELYKLTAYNAMRYGISRYVLAETGWDIIKDEEFREANVVFCRMSQKLKECGKAKVEHHEEIEPEDILKLYSGFDISIPSGLLERWP